MNWIKANWVWVSAFFSLSVAWGQQQQKVETLEQAVVQQVENAREQRALKEQVIRQDEKLKSIERSQQTTEQLLRDILQSNREISRKVSQ